MASGKVKRFVKEAVGGKKTYLPKDKKVKEAADTARYHTRKMQARVKAEAAKEGVDVKGLTKLAKTKRAAKAKGKKGSALAGYAKGSRGYKGASGSDLKELEKRYGKKK